MARLDRPLKGADCAEPRVHFFHSKPPGKPPLTEREIANALATNNHEIIETLYILTWSLYNNEGDRTKTIDSKAAALFGFVGAFISAIFVVLSFLGDPKNGRLASALSGWILNIVIVALFFLVLALLALFWAVVVKKGFMAPDERDLFEKITQYDGCIANSKKKSTTTNHNYKRHLIEHFWKLYNACYSQNEFKAKALYWGQLFVFLALMSLVAVQVNALLSFKSHANSSQDLHSSTSAVHSTTFAATFIGLGESIMNEDTKQLRGK